MAMLKDSLIAGDLRVTGTIYGDVPLNDLVDADDLKAIEALTGTSGLLKKTAANTWTLDTTAYKTGTVTSVRVQATTPVVSSVNTAQSSSLNTTISLADGYGDTKNPYASKTARYVLAAPASAAGAPSFRALTNADVGLGNVENTKLSTWAGSSNITTIGTLSSGTVPWARLSGVPSSFTPAAHNHDSSYVNVSGDTMTGALTLSGDPTSAKHAATKQYVDQSFAANDAMIFKGTIGSSGATVTALPDTHNVGWTYRVLTAGTYAGVKCEIGDLIICIADGTSANNTHWTVAQTNIDGAVIGPSSATGNNFASFNGSTGKLIADSGYSASSFATAGHVHGNLTNDGKIGSDANKAIYTGTSGILQAGTLPVAAGGTGLTTSTYKNAVLIGNASTATNAFRTIRTGNGAFYATAQDGAPQFGTLPLAQGGTGATSFTANSIIMSGSTTTAALTTRAVTNKTSNAAITNNNTNIPTMNTIYYGLVTVNNASQTRATGIYAPTSAGTKNQVLVSAGGTNAPTWATPEWTTVQIVRW